MTEALSAENHQTARVPTNAELDMLSFIILTGIRGIRREIYDHNDPHDAKASIKLLSEIITKWLQP